MTSTNSHFYLSASGWEITGFFLFLALYLAFLVWATTRNTDIDDAIRRAFRGEVDPDDITAALDFPRKQARTAKAIRGEDK